MQSQTWGQLASSHHQGDGQTDLWNEKNWILFTQLASPGEKICFLKTVVCLHPSQFMLETFYTG